MLLRTFTRSLLKPNRINLKSKPIDVAVCIDIECTCDTPVQIHPMEVIELSCLKLDLSKDPQIIEKTSVEHCSDFHSFAKPVINPKLTLFCQELTGVTQSIVDRSPPINSVVEKLLEWMKNVDLIDEKYDKKQEFAFVSCGNFDINLLGPIIKDCHFNSNLNLPIYFKEWINVKKTFFNHKREWPKGLYHMMELLDVEPSGRPHSAEDDCRNLARIVKCLHQDGCKFYVTSKVQ